MVTLFQSGLSKIASSAEFRIKNFKSIKDLKLNLNSVTIVAGPNSSGKSSISQAILTFMQFASRDQSKVKHITDLPLAGDFVKNPPINDLKNMQSKDDEAISFTVSFPTMNTKGKEKKENLSVEIDASNKGSNYASIKRISSELLGINFIPSKKNISENDYVFEPFTSKSNKEPEGSAFSKADIESSLCTRFYSYNPRSAGVGNLEINPKFANKILPVEARHIESNKLIKDICAIEHDGGAIKQIYIKVPLHKLWHFIWQQISKEISDDLKNAQKKEEGYYEEWREDVFNLKPGGSGIIRDKFRHHNIFTTDELVDHNEVKFQDSKHKSMEDIVLNLIETKRIVLITDTLSSPLISSKSKTPDGGNEFAYPYEIMQFSPKRLLPSLASKVYNEDNRRELIRLAKDYDVANNLVSEDNTSKEWVERREEALFGLNKLLQESLDKAINQQKFKIDIDLFSTGFSTFLKAFYNLRTKMQNDEISNNPNIQPKFAYELINIFFLFFSEFRSEPEIGLDFDDIFIDILQREAEDWAELIGTGDKVFDIGLQERTTVNETLSNLLHGGAESYPPFFKEALINEMYTHTDFFELVNKEKLFSERHFKNLFKEVYDSGTKHIMVALNPHDQKIDDTTLSLLGETSKLSNSLMVKDLFNYLNDQRMNPLVQLKDKVIYVPGSSQETPKTLEQIREKMTSDELDGYYALNNTLDKELYNISIKYQRKLDEEFPNSDFAKYFSLNEDELQHFGTSFTFNNRYNKILKYLGLAQGFSVDEQAFGAKEIRYSMNKPNDSQIRESAVGTGVTQVAPVIEAIIEASKITNHGSVLFLEEPETNLHPSAQQKLADILYDLSQFVDVYIETHSEYIINRMRLRELEDKVKDGDTENLNILFTELNDGVTKISNVKIDEFGAIINWPKGFFDQTMEDAQKLLELNLSLRDRNKKDSE